MRDSVPRISCFNHYIEELTYITVYLFGRDQMRDVKSFMYDAASPTEGFMAEEIKKLKEQKKMETKQKKKEEKSQQSKQQTSQNKKGNKKKK